VGRARVDQAPRGVRRQRRSLAARFHTTVFAVFQSASVTRPQPIGQFPKGFAFLADQLRRNTSSVIHNFAEGYYQDSKAEQRRYFGYAIGSAREASTSFDTARAFRVAREKTVVEGKAVALELVKMLPLTYSRAISMFSWMNPAGD